MHVLLILDFLQVGAALEHFPELLAERQDKFSDSVDNLLRFGATSLCTGKL